MKKKEDSPGTEEPKTPKDLKEKEVRTERQRNEMKEKRNEITHHGIVEL